MPLYTQFSICFYVYNLSTVNLLLKITRDIVNGARTVSRNSNDVPCSDYPISSPFFPRRFGLNPPHVRACIFIRIFRNG